MKSSDHCITQLSKLLRDKGFALKKEDLATLEEDLAWTNPDPWNEKRNINVALSAIETHGFHMVAARIQLIRAWAESDYCQ